MAESQSLLDFIESAKGQGASDEFVVALLRQNGWSERRIYQAFGRWYEARTGKAVPSGGGRIEAAKDAFLYLLAFITLGIWTIQLGALLFTVIDRTFPNPAMDYANAATIDWGMAYELAGILVGLPVFLLVTWWIVRDVQRQPERLESPVRKWLTYIALVITASTMIGDLVTFLAYLLRGDLDTRFILKTVTVFVIAGGVFAYYLDSLRPEKVSSSRNRVFAGLALVVAGFGVVVGFVQTGSPGVQRLYSEDARRLSDLSSIAQAIHFQWISRGQAQFVLPATIERVSLVGVPAGGAIIDPVNGKEYEYTPSQGTSYRLCATFSRPSDAGVPAPWRHPAGAACFALDARDNVFIVPRR
ncbi:MAG TPA: DUF5671 domain-containing protein [Bryobacteraceae bacterium]|nr:DUF5671 domain-containing protein [Bryobacteraceae bacterium]